MQTELSTSTKMDTIRSLTTNAIKLLEKRNDIIKLCKGIHTKF